MSQYKFIVYCPDDEELVRRMIKKAGDLGAGTFGNYSHCAFTTKGKGFWKSNEDSHPVLGQPGMSSEESVIRLEMTCDSKLVDEVVEAIRKLHPWEQVDIEVFEIKKTK